ncbi:MULTISPECIES: VOC family protein [unclassified Streptomyces]|uniref:VOC family protein n=1 Tax=unclassified Streptomyces TaxID=2593676 RepID=UPI002E2BE11C|nr:VOC family protein [Streptomyces sp. NBC_01429]
MSHIALVTLVVDDYDKAIAFYTHALGFELVEDTDRGNGSRWVVVRPRPAAGPASPADASTDSAAAPGVPAPDRSSGLLLARAGDDAQRASVGAQTGGRVGFFLHTEDFARDHARMLAAGVRFLEEPRHEQYGTVAVFEDLYGNRWDLLQPA